MRSCSLPGRGTRGEPRGSPLRGVPASPGAPRETAARLHEMELNAGNTAIVLDSTADFPEAAGALPELARRPAVRPVRRRELQRLRRASPTISTRACGLQGDADDVAADARRLPRGLRGARRATSGSSRCTSRRSSPGRSRARARRARRSAAARCASIDSGTVSAGIAMLALAVQRRLERGHDRRGDRRARRALPARRPRSSSRSDTLEFLAARRPDRQAAAIAGDAAEHQADPRRSRTARSCR